MLWGQLRPAPRRGRAGAAAGARRPPGGPGSSSRDELDDPADLPRETPVSALSNQEITARLHDYSAYIELDLLKSERADLVADAYPRRLFPTTIS